MTRKANNRSVRISLLWRRVEQGRLVVWTLTMRSTAQTKTQKNILPFLIMVTMESWSRNKEHSTTKTAR